MIIEENTLIVILRALPYASLSTYFAMIIKGSFVDNLGVKVAD